MQISKHLPEFALTEPLLLRNYVEVKAQGEYNEGYNPAYNDAALDVLVSLWIRIAADYWRTRGDRPMSRWWLAKESIRQLGLALAQLDIQLNAADRRTLKSLLERRGLHVGSPARRFYKDDVMRKAGCAEQPLGFADRFVPSQLCALLLNALGKRVMQLDPSQLPDEFVAFLPEAALLALPKEIEAARYRYEVDQVSIKAEGYGADIYRSNTTEQLIELAAVETGIALGPEQRQEILEYLECDIPF